MEETEPQSIDYAAHLLCNYWCSQYRQFYALVVRCKERKSAKACFFLSKAVSEEIPSLFLIHPLITVALPLRRRWLWNYVLFWDGPKSPVSSVAFLMETEAWHVLPPLSWIDYVHLGIFHFPQRKALLGVVTETEVFAGTRASAAFGCFWHHWITQAESMGVGARAALHVMPTSETVWQDF